MEWITSPEAWAALATLTLLEIVLGIDNIVFISILVNKLPAQIRTKARYIGLGIALGARVLLLLSLSWIMQLSTPLLHLFEHGISGRDLILLGGGLFLIYKATHEIHESLEGDDAQQQGKVAQGFAAVIMQIVVIDLVFSLDSVITAVGMANDLGVMITAVIIAISVMMAASGPIAHFVEQHPTVKMLVLSFLVLVGFTLIAEGLHFHIPKGYIYSAMAFSMAVEVLNLRAKKRRQRKHSAAITLHNPKKAQLDALKLPE